MYVNRLHTSGIVLATSISLALLCSCRTPEPQHAAQARAGETAESPTATEVEPSWPLWEAFRDAYDENTLKSLAATYTGPPLDWRTAGTGEDAIVVYVGPYALDLPRAAGE